MSLLEPNRTPVGTSIIARAGTLLAFMLFGGVVSVYLGKDMSWDVLNYHFYNPWALINGRSGIDMYPAGLQTFFNPVMDFPFYLAARNLPDHLVVFLMGMPFGLALYFFWNTLGVIERDGVNRVDWFRLLNRGVASIFAVVGVAGLSQANTSTGEWTTSALAVLALWALISAHFGVLSWRVGVAIAGAALGLATGLKLTAATVTIAITIALLFLLDLRKRNEFICLYGIYAATGVGAFLIVAGPWMWSLYREFHNPLFPFFNRYFASPLIDMAWMVDERFWPKSWAHVLSWPLEFAFIKDSAHTEVPARDPRPLIGGIISTVWIVLGIVRALREKRITKAIKLKWFLAVAFLTMYVVWMKAFGIYRYAIFLELCAILMAFLVIDDALASSRVRMAAQASALVYSAAVLLTVVPSWGAAEIAGGRYFSASIPELGEGAMVVNLTGDAAGYLLPLWPSHPAIVSPMSSLTNPGFNVGVQQQISDRVKRHRGPIYVLRDASSYKPDALLLLKQYGLLDNPNACLPIERPPLSQLAVCRMTRR